MKIRILLMSLCLALGVVSTSNAEVKPASIFGSNMVLQRGEPIKIWGTAAKNEKVEVTFNGQKATAKAGKDGKWSVTLKAMPEGGPYTMTIRGKDNSVEFGNVMMGEVWLCSGQSNMEMTVVGVLNSEKEIAEANYPMIRCFTVEKNIAGEPKDAFDGKWDVSSPETVPYFTAAGYFFARKLWEELGVPVGIINSSWGGTDIEAWTSPESYEALPAEVRRQYDPAANEYIRNMVTDNIAESREKFRAAMDNDPALAEKWYENPDLSQWKTVQVPSRWSTTEFSKDDGHVWYRREFQLPESAAGSKGFLSLGPIDDHDITWINGVQVGKTERYDLLREYQVEPGILKAGSNVVTVRVTDNTADGGIYGEPAQLFITVDNVTYPLAGEWQYRPSVLSTSFGLYDLNPNQYYATLYNGMINPVVGFRIKGVLWYQGENNVGNSRSYRTLFPNMINDWRSKWGYEFPFYWVQLADFMAEDAVPSESGWAELREAQTMTLSVPQSGQAVIIDIGDAADIHPRNKQEVGRRLALNALNKDYGQTSLVYSGPVYSSVEFDGNRAIVSFDTMGSDLIARDKYGYVRGFAVAGADRVFHWAKAWIEDGKVVVESDAVEKPVAVRYAWGNNPQANLFNSEGLPAGPFRTDDWPGITR